MIDSTMFKKGTFLVARFKKKAFNVPESSQYKAIVNILFKVSLFFLNQRCQTP